MSHGGERYGAGRPATHVTVESLRRLDIRAMARADALVEGGGAWIWTDRACASFSLAADVLTLRHSLLGRHVSQAVPILRTACLYGGTRPWFGCPHCGGRVAVLLLRGGGFGCKRCVMASYTSQRESDVDRAARAKSKAVQRLDRVGLRPKGMHNTTYNAILANAIDAEYRHSQTLTAGWQRLALFGWKVRDM